MSQSLQLHIDTDLGIIPCVLKTGKSWNNEAEQVFHC